MTGPVNARLDADDRLVETDAALARLNAAAGAEDDALVLIPLLTVARLARRLGTLIARPVLLADDDEDVELWVRAQPAANGAVRLTLAEWRSRPARPPREPVEPAQDGAGALLPPDLAGPLRRALDRPIRGIVATAESLRAVGGDEVPQTYRDYARDIANAGRHLQALLDDLVTLNGVEDDPPIAADRIDLADVARRAADLLTVRAARAGMTVEVPAGPAWALGDFRRALQVAVNLIGNAISHAPDDTTVRVTCSADHAATTLSVEDEGLGVQVGERERVFERFVRLNPGDTPGSGLGLYISRRLARAMDGDVVVGAADGGGARFVLRLPAA